MADPAVSYELVTHGSVREIGEAAYRDLVSDTTPPFLHFEWLDALEQSGCVAPDRGWMPLFLALHSLKAGRRRLVAVAPAYVKWHSDGEFVFDHSWAQFAEQRLGIDYYPKLVLACPFTPATGPKVLVRAGEDVARVHAALSDGIERLLSQIPLSSAHVLFPPDEDAELWGALGWARRFGVQFHWENAGYASYDDFLARFSAKRRAALRREERELTAQGVCLEIHTGADLDEELLDAAYRFYLSTVDKHVWGRRYLNREFFMTVGQTMPDRLHLVMARDRATGRCLGGAFNLLGHDALYGRYWGAIEERPFLHFNVCFYAGIRDCITRGLRRFEPGAGGEHKLSRGFEATVTHSAHRIVDPQLDGAVREFLSRERAGVLAAVARARAESALRPARSELADSGAPGSGPRGSGPRGSVPRGSVPRGSGPPTQGGR